MFHKKNKVWKFCETVPFTASLIENTIPFLGAVLEREHIPYVHRQYIYLITSERLILLNEIYVQLYLGVTGGGYFMYLNLWWKMSIGEIFATYRKCIDHVPFIVSSPVSSNIYDIDMSFSWLQNYTPHRASRDSLRRFYNLIIYTQKSTIEGRWFTLIWFFPATSNSQRYWNQNLSAGHRGCQSLHNPNFADVTLIFQTKISYSLGSVTRPG
jgi:hypothetical protein